MSREAMHELMAATLDTVMGEIRRIKANARENGFTERPLWPMIVLRTPKGWTCPKEIDGRRTEGYWRAHQVPMGEMHENPLTRSELLRLGGGHASRPALCQDDHLRDACRRVYPASELGRRSGQTRAPTPD